MKKIAIIDIGTNSMRLMIATVKNNNIMERQKIIKPTRIGEEINENKQINPAAFERNYKALKKFKEKAINAKVEEIIVFGTSALRDAINADIFIKKVKDELGLSIEVLTGKEEAEIGFKGAINDMAGDVLVLDIGGGSTEFILGNRKYGIKDMISLNIGAVRLGEKYKKSEPVNQEDIEKLQDMVGEMLEQIPSNFENISNIIGIGGTITSMVSIRQEMKTYDWEKIHGSSLSRQDIGNILKKLTLLNLEERKKLPGLHPSRADIIIEGNIILQCILDRLAINYITISEHDNLEGMLLKKLEKNKKTKKY